MRTRLRRFRRLAITCVAATSTVIGVAPVAAQAQSSDGGSTFVATQGRVLDTRAASQVGPYSTPMTADEWRTVPIAGIAGVPTSGVSAVQVTVGALPNGTSGTIKVSEDLDLPQPQVAVDYGAAGGAISNTAIIPMNTSGNVLVEATTAANVFVDVQGYFTSASTGSNSGYSPITPTRVLSTPGGIGIAPGPVAPGSTTRIQIGGIGAIPAGATAAFLNIAVGNANGASDSYATVWPADQPKPDTALRFTAGTTTAFGSSVGLSSDGAVNVYVGGSDPVDLWVDVEGYFDGTAQSQQFIADSSSLGPDLTLAPQSTITAQIAGAGDVPDMGFGVSAVSAELEATPSGSDAGYLTIWPDDASKPNTSELSLQRAAAPVSNFDTMKLGSDGGVKIHNSSPDTVTLAIEAEGFYIPPDETGPSAVVAQEFSTSVTTSATIDPTTDDVSYTGVDAAETDQYDSSGNLVSSTDNTASGQAGFDAGAADTTNGTAPDSDPHMTTVSGAGTGGTGTSYTCTLPVKQNDGLAAGTVGKVHYGGLSHFEQFTFNPYGVKNARQVGGLWTFQWEFCVTGGGDVWNGYHADWTGAGVELESTSTQLINQKWGDTVDKNTGTIHQQISFKVSAGPVTVNASEVLSSHGSYAGQVGPVTHLCQNKPKCFQGKWSSNEVSAEYHSPSTFIWNGTSAWEGNVFHALYEWPMRDTAPRTVKYEVNQWGFCAHPDGFGCSDWDK